MHRYSAATAGPARRYLSRGLMPADIGAAESGQLFSVAMMVAAVLIAWIPLMLIISSFWLGWPSWIAEWLTSGRG